MSKITPDLQRIIDRMAPGVLCRDGFLGSDHRSLPEIIETDDAVVDRLGTSHAAIARRLGQILEKAEAAMGRPVEVGRGATAVFHEGMGWIASPWADGKVFEKGEVELRTAGGAVLRFTPLSVHLIAHHGFYQGRGLRYRLEPGVLCEALGLGRFAEGGGPDEPDTTRPGQ